MAQTELAGMLVDDSVFACATDKTDRVFYEKPLCTCPAICPYKTSQLFSFTSNRDKKYPKCTKWGLPESTAEIAKLAAEPSSEQEGKQDDVNACSSGPEFYLGGLCLANDRDNCKHKTPVRFRVSIEHMLLERGRDYPKCTKYYPVERCAGKGSSAGTMMLFHNGICLATDSQVCPHQSNDNIVELGGRTYANCDRFNV